MTPDQRTALLKLSAGRALFFADTPAQTHIHRQLVMRGWAFCRVEFSGEYISISDKGKQAVSQ